MGEEAVCVILNMGEEHLGVDNSPLVCPKEVKPIGRAPLRDEVATVCPQGIDEVEATHTVRLCTMYK